MSTSEIPSSRALISLSTSQPRSPSHPRGPPVSRPLISNANEIQQWQPILHASNQVVLYNPQSHALSIVSAATNLAPVVVARNHRTGRIGITHTVDDIAVDSCPYCKQALPPGFHAYPRTTERHEDDADSDAGRWEDVLDSEEGEFEAVSTDPAYHSRASDYFRLLAIASETSSLASGSRRHSLSPPESERSEWRTRSRSRQGRAVGRGLDENRSTRNAFPADKMAEGYFKMFFQEEYKLGMGANGSVFLCQHVLDGNSLGHFAVKKIAVGESHSYLLNILREVRLLERLHHPNIITYHHAWLETSQFSSFGPKVPTLHVLMQWAEGGSLDDFIDVRLGRKSAHIHMHPLFSSSPFGESVPPSPSSSTQELQEEDTKPDPTTPRQTYTLPEKGKHQQPATQDSASPLKQPEDPHSRSARIRAFRAYQRAPPEEKERMRVETLDGVGVLGPASGPAASGAGQQNWTPVHLLSADEVKSLFRDVVEGLNFLHSKSILHLDLKPGNVLLTWDEGRLIPRAMLSDFGTSRDMINSSRTQRSGNTGTLEYTAPESLPSPLTGRLSQIDSKADMWSLGMILHKLLFFKLPYRYAAQGDANDEPMSRDVAMGGEAEKMDRLEREVREYPGFKSTANLVVGFETRRLPRAFLVLLENLLHTTPASRPSCERVAIAIRDGKLDPVAANVAKNLPLARPTVRTPESNAEAAPPELGAAPERTLLLALPSPDEVLGPEEPTSSPRWSGWPSWLSLVLPRGSAGLSDARSTTTSRKRPRLETRRQDVEGWRVVSGKLARSSLLVLKVMTIPRLCADPTTRPRPLVAALLLALAVGDTIIDHRGYEDESGVRVGGSRGRGRGRTGGQDRLEGGRVSWVRALGSRLGLGLGRGAWISLGLAVLHFGVLALSGRSAPDGDGLLAGLCCAPMEADLVVAMPSAR